MFSWSVRGTQVVIATAVAAAVGLFLLVVNLAEHQHQSRILLEMILFLPLLLCAVTVRHARRS